MPTKLPFRAMEEYRMDLQQYRLDRYKSSTCKRQALPRMKGLPMQIMVGP